jgi:hypothetical protein
LQNPSDYAPQIGGPTPIICGITPRTEQRLYRDGLRIQSPAGFSRLLDRSFQPTQHEARKVRVTGYLLWDDDHNGGADVGSTIQCIGSNRFHHPWRSTGWEIHDLISDALPFARLWYAEPNAISNAIGYAKFFSRSHNTLIRVCDVAGNVIETHEHTGDFKEWCFWGNFVSSFP